MERLKNKVAVITGGGSGVGLATAREFIANGAKVVIFGKTKDNVELAVKELGKNSFGVVGDVTSMFDLDALFAETKKKFGGIDVLYVNAAKAKLVPIEHTTEELFDEVINTNFKGSFFTIQKSIPYLNNNASVIVTTSWLNRIGFENAGLLGSGKAALRALVRVGSKELASRGIRMNAVSPGAVETALWGKLGIPTDILAATGEALTQQIPMKRWAKAEEIAKAVLFLASDESSYVAGHELVVDGGLLL
jgi:NAD(P)-dependent dehydrogenase (short-subunit alcohol dehydrogenase family)